MIRRVLLLDTSAVVDFLRGRTVGVRAGIARARATEREVAVSSVTMFELWDGASRGAYAERNAERLRDFLRGGITVVPFEHEDAELAGALRARLERAGTPIGPYDILIAAHALRLGATLVTGNVGEFARVPELTVEHWGRPA